MHNRVHEKDVLHIALMNMWNRKTIMFAINLCSDNLNEKHYLKQFFL